jgi:large subunit ribosomal protein L2
MGKRVGAQRKGRGGSVYRSPGHRYKAGKNGIKYIKTRGDKNKQKAKVAKLVHDSGRSAVLAELEYRDGSKDLMIAPEGLKVEQEIEIEGKASIRPGNILPLKAIPEGTPVFNVEGNPGDGGKFVRASGTSATVVSHGMRTVIQLPSGQFKPFHPDCRATIGVIAGGGRLEKPLAKAGRKLKITRSRGRKYPKVSGVAMNPVNHPHGGGAHQHVGGPSSVSKHAPPGKKVGRISSKKKKKKRK